MYLNHIAGNNGGHSIWPFALKSYIGNTSGRFRFGQYIAIVVPMLEFHPARCMGLKWRKTCHIHVQSFLEIVMLT